jgi:hypothetical protein
VAEPVPLGPQLRRRQSLEVRAAGGVDGQDLAASPGQGLGQLQVAVGPLAGWEVQLAGATGFGANHGVQPGVLAGSGQLHVQPVDVLGAGEPDQGPPAGQSLGPVAGGRVGQVHPPVTLPAAAAIQIAPRQRELPVVGAVQPDGQGAGLGVEGGHDPAAAVGHPELFLRG